MNLNVKLIELIPISILGVTGVLLLGIAVLAISFHKNNRR